MSSVAYRSPKKSSSVGFATGFKEIVTDFALSDFASFPEFWTSDFCNEFCPSSSAVSSSFSADGWYSRELLSFFSEKKLQARNKEKKKSNVFYIIRARMKTKTTNSIKGAIRNREITESYINISLFAIENSWLDIWYISKHILIKTGMTAIC